MAAAGVLLCTKKDPAFVLKQLCVFAKKKNKFFLHGDFLVQHSVLLVRCRPFGLFL